MPKNAVLCAIGWLCLPCAEMIGGLAASGLKSRRPGAPGAMCKRVLAKAGALPHAAREPRYLVQK